jgi:hypothetical protein
MKVKTIRHFTASSFWPDIELNNYLVDLEEVGYEIIKITKMSKFLGIFGDDIWEIELTKNSETK